MLATGITSQQKLSPSEGAILHVKQWGPLLMYVTQRGGVHAWDTRMKRDAWVLPASPRLGLVGHTALDSSERGTWLLTGSSRGYLALWDVRFQLQVSKHHRLISKTCLRCIGYHCGSTDKHGLVDIGVVGL